MEKEIEIGDQVLILPNSWEILEEDEEYLDLEKKYYDSFLAGKIFRVIGYRKLGHYGRDEFFLKHDKSTVYVLLKDIKLLKKGQ